MRKILWSVKNLILFEFPSRYDNIRTQFASSHENYQKQFAHWGSEATRKKTIANYWIEQIQFHLTLVILAVISCLPFFK